MNHFVSKKAAKTTFVRSPITGPEPANTLVYLTCVTPGVEIGLSGGWVTWTHAFQTEFKIDGFQQQNYDWYVQNTVVSATAMLRFLNTTTDLIFAFGVDTVEPALEKDGALGFVLGQANYIDDEAILFGGGEAVFEVRVSAYVLCYEPRVEPPPRGSLKGRWAPTQPFYELMRRKEATGAAAIKESSAAGVICRGAAPSPSLHRPCRTKD
jgi:hypothetical protein